VILLPPMLAAAVGALYGVIAGALTGVALVVLRSYALGARRRARTIGFVMSAAPWVLATRLEAFPIYLLAGVFSGVAGAFLAPWVLYGLPRRARSVHE
jgi:hypothetical protein